MGETNTASSAASWLFLFNCDVQSECSRGSVASEKAEFKLVVPEGADWRTRSTNMTGHRASPLIRLSEPLIELEVAMVTVTNQWGADSPAHSDGFKCREENSDLICSVNELELKHRPVYAAAPRIKQRLYTFNTHTPILQSQVQNQPFLKLNRNVLSAALI